MELTIKDLTNLKLQKLDQTKITPFLTTLEHKIKWRTRKSSVDQGGLFSDWTELLSSSKFYYNCCHKKQFIRLNNMTSCWLKKKDEKALLLLLFECALV